MSHLVRYGIYVKTSDFKSFWKTTTACQRDGCSAVKLIPFHKGKSSKAVEERFFKKMEEREGPSSYTVNAYDLGLDHFEVWKKVSRIVDHKRTEVTEKKAYKTRPKRILKGGFLHEVHLYVCDYDVREYDPLEHEGFRI